MKPVVLVKLGRAAFPQVLQASEFPAGVFVCKQPGYLITVIARFPGNDKIDFVSASVSVKEYMLRAIAPAEVSKDQVFQPGCILGKMGKKLVPCVNFFLCLIGFQGEVRPIRRNLFPGKHEPGGITGLSACHGRPPFASATNHS